MDTTQSMHNGMPEGFTPPRHWVGTEELSAQYWTDQKTQERRGQEFFDKPVETVAMIEKMDTKGIARRDFLTIMGASMAMASLSCARRPVNKIIPYVVKPEEITPGVSTWYASTFPETGEGLLVRTREGRPIKLEGNPDHPVNRGKLSARAQASLLELYDPERLQGPVLRGRDGQSGRPATWKEIDERVSVALKKTGRSGRVRVLSGAVRSDTGRRLVAEFLSAFGASASALVEFEPAGLDEISQGQLESYGEAVVPRWRFDQAELIVSFGADFLGAWPGSTEHSADWIKGRKLDSKKSGRAEMSKLVAYESAFTVTGANADERYPVRPGDELKVALAIAYELIVQRKLTPYAGQAAVVAALDGYRPEGIASELGLIGGAEKLKAVAAELWASRGRGLVVAGSLQAKSRDALALQVVANFLNSALGNEGASVDADSSLPVSSSSGFGALASLVEEMNAGKVDVLFIHRANPVYALSRTVDFAAALKKVPVVVAVADREEETASLCDVVAPDHHYLENWGDAQVRRGLISVQQPVIQPLFDTRGFEESLIAWARASGMANGGLLARIAAAEGEEGTWHAYLKASWNERVYPQVGSLAGFEAFWEGALREGVVRLRSFSADARGSARSFRSGALTRIPRYRPTPEGVFLGLYQKVSMGDGRAANNAWLQEMPDPITTGTWDNYLNVGPALAKSMSLNTNDVVEVAAGDLKIELPVLVQPGMHASAVTAAVGYGRTLAGKVGNGVGVNVFPFARVEGGSLVSAGIPVKLRKTGRVYRLATTQWHHQSENRPVINDITLADFRKNPGMSNHTDPHLRMEEVPTMWTPHSFPGYKWGMAIDLTSCTGCGACVIACQAENNIPVVGRENVRVSREMHWIRIDRYYSGNPEQPDVVFSPMLCQQCENAPCETVCPVLATVHDEEGLNEQIYNRCVGTRYCQNNCPYKVRRFNFFDHWKNYEGTLNMVWNPDVTVRSRGIMEKCTFCIQRIRDGKDQAKDKGVRVADGDIRTACQQTCPTDAIVFGDINDPKSAVSQLREDKRAFRVLEVLNTRPVISYMTKVRNKEGSSAHEESHGHA